MSSTKVAKTAPAATGVITSEMAAMLQADAGAGMEDMGKDDFALPFLKILQALSPEVQRGNPRYVANARPGDFLNSITSELHPGEDGVELVRVAFEKKWLEWRPKETGGGLVRVSASAEEAAAHRIPAIGNEETDTEIVETAQIYCLMNTSDSGWRPVVLPWTKSKLKVSRNWNAKMGEQTFKKWGVAESTKTLPVMAVVYRLTTRSEAGKKGDYFVPVVEPAGLVADAVYEAAKAFRDIVVAGKTKVVYEPDPELSGAAAEDVPGAADDVV